MTAWPPGSSPTIAPPPATPAIPGPQNATAGHADPAVAAGREAPGGIVTAVVCLLVFLDTVLWFAAVPLLPGWERDLGLSSDQAGIVVGAYSAALLVVSMPVGVVADRLGPRRVTIGASAALVLAGPGLAFATSFGGLVAVRFAQGACSAAAWSAGLAWVVAAAGDGGRARALAWVNTTGAGAMVAGPLVGGPAVAAFGLRATMFGVAAAVAAGVVVALAAPAGRVRRPDAAARSARAELALIARARGRLRLALGAIAVVAGAAAVVQVLAPLHLDDAGLDAGAIGIVFTAGAAVSLLESLVIVRLADRIPRVRAMGLALGTLGALLAVLALAPGVELYAVVVVATAAATAPVFILAYPTCIEGADEQGVGQGAALGALNTLWAAGALVAPVGAGVIAGVRGDGAAFAIAAVLAVSGMALLLRPRSPAPAG